MNFFSFKKNSSKKDQIIIQLKDKKNNFEEKIEQMKIFKKQIDKNMEVLREENVSFKYI